VYFLLPQTFELVLQRLQAEFRVTGMALSWFRSYLSSRSQFKLTNQQSPAVSLIVGVPQASVLGPILCVLNCSAVGDDADDVQLHLDMRADNTAVGLSVLAVCTSDVRL